MSKKIFILLILITLFLACPPVEQNTQTVSNPLEKFNGKWKSKNSSPPYDDWFELKIDDETFFYYNNGDPTNDLGYAGKIVSFDLSGDIYFLNLKITNRGSWDLTTDWYARIYLQKTNSTIVKQAIGATGTYPNIIMVKPTLGEAKQTFTIENNAYQYLGEYIAK
ncbi:MAG TPA: hypothetical protein PLE45_05820 [Spirochaetota bacterium]|nr:hypothetical protein [Spirochaetota bacterium]HOL56799.1 hypothetical protein [Spirochaetota bacterium]HPP04266.1 hypothetical protein [Spirochaetota bacterium]